MVRDARPPHLTVVVPTYRRPQLLRLCLESLQKQTAADGEFEVVVVDDASGPDTVAVLEALEARMPNLKWASQPGNRGPAAARNRAVSMAEGDLLLFIDDDIVASPTLVERHLAAHAEERGSVGVVGHVAWLPSLPVTDFMEWLEAGTLQFAFSSMKAGIQADPTNGFYTCNLSLRRADYLAVGGFDERFPYPAYEDTELAVRLYEQCGFRLDYHPDALAWHSRAVTLAEFCARMTKVGESAVIFEQVRPNTRVVVDDLAYYRHGAPTRVAVAALHRFVPRVFGRDLRGSYYLSRVSAAYQKGLRRAAAR
ncbi:MAG TPA: glycosyltransferase [Mycobacteriales bacterium]|nr:glycosyltransferase [Mycobacteriales bacterium]